MTHRMTSPIVKVGCCGFAAAHAKYYATFPVVEVQQTFYQPMRPATAERWREGAPPTFEFVLKAWQLITHEARSPTYRRLKIPLTEAEKGEAGGFRPSGVVLRAWETTLEIARALAADKVLFQCPASFTPNDENKDRMRAFFEAIDRRGIVCIWEPRGSWEPDEIGALCRELRLAHCVDPFQDEVVTSELRYYRLHGIETYRHTYSDQDLNELLARRSPEHPTYFMFNNAPMFGDAQRFQKLLG